MQVAVATVAQGPGQLGGEARAVFHHTFLCSKGGREGGGGGGGRGGGACQGMKASIPPFSRSALLHFLGHLTARVIGQPEVVLHQAERLGQVMTFQPGNEKDNDVSECDVTDNDVIDNNVSGNDVTDSKVTDNDVTDNNNNSNDVSDNVSDNDVTDKNMHTQKEKNCFFPSPFSSFLP